MRRAKKGRIRPTAPAFRRCVRIPSLKIGRVSIFRNGFSVDWRKVEIGSRRILPPVSVRGTVVDQTAVPHGIEAVGKHRTGVETPRNMETAEIVGVVVAAFILPLSMQVLHVGTPGGIGGPSPPAPQAGLMALMAKGIVESF
jgi:hypothetical protein